MTELQFQPTVNTISLVLIPSTQQPPTFPGILPLDSVKLANFVCLIENLNEYSICMQTLHFPIYYVHTYTALKSPLQNAYTFESPPK